MNQRRTTYLLILLIAASIATALIGIGRVHAREDAARAAQRDLLLVREALTQLDPAKKTNRPVDVVGAIRAAAEQAQVSGALLGLEPGPTPTAPTMVRFANLRLVQLMGFLKSLQSDGSVNPETIECIADPSVTGDDWSVMVSVVRRGT